jgi:hypothetical protein
LQSFLVICALAVLVACANTSMLTNETRAVESVTAARQVSTAMLRAGKITVAQDVDNQKKLDAVRQSIVAAKNAADAQALAKAKKDADAITTQLGGNPAP